MNLTLVIFPALGVLGACFIFLRVRGHWLPKKNETCYRTFCGCFCRPSLGEYLAVAIVAMKSKYAAVLMFLKLQRKNKSDDEETSGLTTDACLVRNSTSLLWASTFAIITFISLLALIAFGRVHPLENCPRFIDRGGQKVLSPSPIDLALGFNFQWLCLVGAKSYLELDNGRQEVLDAISPAFHLNEWTGEVSATMPSESLIAKLVYTCMREHVQFNCFVDFRVQEKKREAPRPSRNPISPTQRHQENQLDLIFVVFFTIVVGSLCLFFCIACIAPLVCMCCCCSLL